MIKPIRDYIYIYKSLVDKGRVFINCIKKSIIDHIYRSYI